MDKVEQSIWMRMRSKEDLKDPKNPLHDQYQKELDKENKDNDQKIKELDRVNKGKWWRTS